MDTTSQGPSVLLDDGRRIEGDLIVGADGRKNTLKRSLRNADARRLVVQNT